MKKTNLFEKVSALGLPLFQPEDYTDANLTLAEMVRSKDLRLWEGFTVVLANCAQKGQFDYGKTAAYLKNNSDRENLLSLLAMSLAVFKLSDMVSSWEKSLYENLPVSVKRKFESYNKVFKGEDDFYVGTSRMSVQRVRTVFQNYFQQSNAGMKDLLSAKDEFNLEFSLSQVFSPKQKELFLKKLKHEKLTKTEKEYFSRVVRKKTLALADPQLNRLAQELLR